MSLHQGFWEMTSVCNGMCRHCLPEGTKVIGNEFIAGIEALGRSFRKDPFGLEVADVDIKVYNTSLDRAVRVIRHKYKGVLYKVIPHCFFPVLLTRGHEVFVVYRGLVKKPVETLRKGDYLFVPIPKIEKEVTEIDVYELLKDIKIRRKSNYEKLVKIKENIRMKSKELSKIVGLHPARVRTLRGKIKKGGTYDTVGVVVDGDMVRFKFGKTKIPRILKVDKDLAFIIGLYVAEGCVTKNAERSNSFVVRFSFGKHELKLASKLAKSIKRKFKLEAKIKKTKTGYVVKVNSNIFGWFIKKFCGENSYNKKVPEFIRHAPADVIKEFIYSYWLGDGCFKNNVALTVSEELAYGIVFCSLRIGVLPKVKITKTRVGFMKERLLKGGKTAYMLRFRRKEMEFIAGKIDYDELYRGHTCKVMRIEGGFKLIVDAIEKVPHNGYVYDLEVEKNHSFCANFVLVSNCMYSSGYRDKRELDLDSKFEVMEKMYEMGITNLVILGGEPTILPYFYKILSASVQIFPKVVVQTNGYVMEDEYFNFPAEWVVSLESDRQEENDWIRGEGAFERTIKNLYKFSVIKGKEITIRATLTQKTDVEAMCKLALKLKTNLLFMRFMPMGRGSVIKELVPTEEKMVETYLTLLRYKREFNSIKRKIEILDPQYAFLVRWNARYIKYFEKDKTACPAARHRILIDHRGNYYPCNFLLKKLGNILKDDIEKINERCKKFYEEWNSFGFRHSRRDCPFRRICSGGCKAMMFLTNKACFNCPIPKLISEHKSELLKTTDLTQEVIGGV